MLEETQPLLGVPNPPPVWCDALQLRPSASCSDITPPGRGAVLSGVGFRVEMVEVGDLSSGRWQPDVCLCVSVCVYMIRGHDVV